MVSCISKTPHQATNRRNINDRPSPAISHNRQNRFGSKIDAGNIYIHNFIPNFQTRIFDQGTWRDCFLNFHCGVAARNTSYVSQHVNISMQLYCFVYKLGPRIFTCYIQMLIDSLPASFHYFQNHVFA